MSAGRFDWRGVVSRALFSSFTVFALYNPTGTSYLHWVLDGFNLLWAKLAVGAGLSAVLCVLWRTARGTLGRIGMAMVLAFCLGTGATLLALTGIGLFESHVLLLWGLLTLAGLFTAGLCYSHIHHRLGGITHTEEVKG